MMPRTRRKAKEVRDPTQPKRALGAYMLFAIDKRGEIKEAHPDWGFADIGRYQGALWKRLSEQEKQKYQDLAARDKERYEEEMLVWAQGKQGTSSNHWWHNDATLWHNDATPRLNDDSNRPKKPQSAYMWFATDHRNELQAAHPAWGVAELDNATGAMWKELSDEDRKMYEDKAAWDKNRYEEEMTSFMKASKGASVENAASVHVKAEPNIKPEPVVKPEPDAKADLNVKLDPHVKTEF